MRFVTFEREGFGLEPGVIVGDDIVGLKGAGFPTLLAVIEAGPTATERIKGWIDKHPSEETVRLTSARLRAPLQRPPKIVCVGMNYRDHILECKDEIPKVPTVFSKYNTSIIGPGEQIILPRASSKPDYEAEFALVIGNGGRYIAADHWRDHVFGYTNFNDVSARDVQYATSQWMVGKTFDTFAPMGPAIVTADEIPEPHAVDIQMIINGEILQSSNTSQLVFRIPYLIEYLSGVFTLEPGDVISTGTPAGVGEARNPPRWLRPGDEVVVRTSVIGDLRNPVRAE